jgi:uncharacterized protein (UPF0335 family)
MPTKTKQLTSFEGLKKGTKIMITGNHNSHNYPMGVPLTLRMDGIHGTAMIDCIIEDRGSTGSHNTLDIRDVEIIVATISVNDMRAHLEELEREKADIQHKLKVCEEFETDSYDDKVFEVYDALKKADKAKTLKERAIIIKEMLFGGAGM